MQTSVPAVTSRSAPGSPRLTAWSSSCPLTASTVYCQPSAQSGPSTARTDTFPGSTSSRSSPITPLAEGRPAQSVATAAAVGVGSVGVAGRVGVSGGRVGAVVGGTVTAGVGGATGIATRRSGGAAHPVAGSTASRATASRAVTGRRCGGRCAGSGGTGRSSGESRGGGGTGRAGQIAEKKVSEPATDPSVSIGVEMASTVA